MSRAPVVFLSRVKGQREIETVEANRQKWPRWRVLIVFMLALASRMLAAKLFPMDPQRDPDAFVQLGSNLYWRGIYGLRNYYDVFHFSDDSPISTAYRPPMYPLIVAGCSPLGNGAIHLLAAIHVLLGAATASLAFLIAERWNLSKRGALLAAALVAFDPILLHQAVQPMTETLAAFLAACGLHVLTTAGSRLNMFSTMLAGVVLGAAELCRPTFLVWLGLSWLALIAISHGWRQRLAVGCSFAVAAAVVISPWAVRNYRVFDRPIITTTHGGFTLALANNPQFYRHLSEQGWFVPWDEALFSIETPTNALHHGNEIAMERASYAQAFATIRDEPRMFFVSCLYRLSRLWGVCPLALDPQESAGRRALRYAVALFYVFEFALSGYGAWIVGKNWLKTPWLWGLLLVLSFTAVHTLYWTDMRMRAPLVIVIALAAGAALSATRLTAGEQSLAAQEVASPGLASNLP